MLKFHALLIHLNLMSWTMHPCACPLVCKLVHVCEFMHIFIHAHKCAFMYVSACMHEYDCICMLFHAGISLSTSSRVGNYIYVFRLVNWFPSP